MKFKLYTPQAILEQGERQNQEDCIFPLPGEATAASRLFIVCDGMGGHDCGEVASTVVCQAISRAMDRLNTEEEPLSDEQFRQVIGEAYRALEAADTGHKAEMGTTLAFVCLHKGGCLAAHIGDSRIYHLRPRTGEVLYRSRDHSLVQQLYELGKISYYDMFTSPQRNIIQEAMQPFQETRSSATVVHITDIRKDDYLYLCSDGMLEVMDDDQLLNILKAHTNDEKKAQKLRHYTAGNLDNHSAYLIHIQDVEAEENDDLLPNDEKEERQKNKALNDPCKDMPWEAISSILS